MRNDSAKWKNQSHVYMLIFCLLKVPLFDLFVLSGEVCRIVLYFEVAAVSTPEKEFQGYCLGVLGFFFFAWYALIYYPRSN